MTATWTVTENGGTIFVGDKIETANSHKTGTVLEISLHPQNPNYSVVKYVTDEGNVNFTSVKRPIQ